MQLDSSFNLSQLWALSACFWPRYAIFREPFFHRLTKSPIAPNFVTFHWPTTPYNASMRILAADLVHAWPGLFLSQLVIKFLHSKANPGMEGRWKVPILSVLATCLVPSSVHVKPIFEDQQSDTGMRLCTHTHTHEAYPSTTWFIWWQKSIMCLPPRCGGPEKGPALGHLGTINPKISSIKQPSRQAF